MDVIVPELAEVDVMLEPDMDEVRLRLGEGNVKRPSALHGIFTLGIPIVQPVTTALAGDDMALQAFLVEERAAARFFLVHLSCSFRPPKGADFEEAWVTVHLRTDDGETAASTAISWSMNPRRETRVASRSRTLKLDAKLSFIEASAEFGDEGEADEVFIESFGLREATCTWEFRRTHAQALRGSQSLALVARCPTHTETSGLVEVQATLRMRKFGLIPFWANMPEHEPISFSLGSQD